MIYLIIILYLVNNFLALKLNIHIFQLNYYRPDVQMKWLSKNYLQFLIIFIINIVQVYLLIKKLSLIFSVILLLVNIYLMIEKNVVKKIVFTNRVKRLYLTNYIVFCFLALIFYKHYNYLVIIFFIINGLPTLYMILVNYINLPINKLINNYYVNDAKKKLKSMPNLKIIAITGSYGKTSTKDYVTKLLSSKYNVLNTPGNFNTLLGITRTIREELTPVHEVFVCEVGIDKVGEMEEIIKLIKPDYCMITAIGSQHLETFKTQENITNSKMKLLDGLKQDGIAFLNLDSEFINSYKITKDYIGYGLVNNKNNDLLLNNILYSSNGLSFDLTKEKEVYKVSSSLLGQHNLINLYGAITVANKLEVPMKTIINEVKHISNVDHRLKLIPGEKFSIIDDSYNSNPVGASNALKTLKQFDGFKILMTPGMVELGNKQDEYNYNFGKEAATCSDYIYLINEEATKEIYNALKDEKYDLQKVKIFKTFKEAMDDVLKIETNGKHKYILIENDLPDNYK